MDLAADVERRPVVVLGLMGAGKSSVAGLVAGELGWAVRDSDRDIESASGHTAAQLQRAEGTEALHTLEARHLLDSLAARPPAVIAAAASTVEVPECRTALGSAFVVWLDADPAVLAARFDAGPHRPRYGVDQLVVLRTQDQARRPLFEAVADIRLDSGAMEPGPLAVAALRAFRETAGRDPAPVLGLRADAAPVSVGTMVSPIQLQKYLKGMSYPAKKDDIVEHAKSNGADETYVDALTSIKDGTYDTPASISHAISEAGKT